MQYLRLLTILLVILASCKKKKDTAPVTKPKIEGVSQKGPFVNGSAVTLFELNDKYVQTGKTYNAQIKDNQGLFELKDVELQSQYVKVKADGYYFNEVSGENSKGTLSLYAMSDVYDKSSINVNLLTHLESGRVEYLVGNGSSFADAKKKAQEEVLKIFSISKSNMPESEQLDISKSGDDNAILLAVSVILQGYRTEAELSQLLGDIATDIRTDGVLNSQPLGSELLNAAKLMDMQTVRNNLENRYTTLGITTTIPDFEKYVKHLFENTSFTFTAKIEYPKVYKGMANLLADTAITVVGNTNYAFAAKLPHGTAIKVVVKQSPYNGYYAFSYWGGDNLDWEVETLIDTTDLTNIFTATGTNEVVNVPVMFGPPGFAEISIYENGSSTPISVKTAGYK